MWLSGPPLPPAPAGQQASREAVCPPQCLAHPDTHCPSPTASCLLPLPHSPLSLQFLLPTPIGHSPREGEPTQNPSRAGRAHRAEPGSRRQGAGPRQALTFTLLTPGTAAAIAEAGVLVRGREAGRGPRVLVGVALAQGPGGRVGQWGQRVLVRGPAGAAVEVQGFEIWQEGTAGESGRGGLPGTPALQPHSLLHRSPKT